MLSNPPAGQPRTDVKHTISILREYFVDEGLDVEDSFLEELAKSKFLQDSLMGFGTYILEPQGDISKALKQVARRSDKLLESLVALLKLDNGHDALFSWEMDFSGIGKTPAATLLSMLAALKDFDEHYVHYANPKDRYHLFIKKIADIFD